MIYLIDPTKGQPTLNLCIPLQPCPWYCPHRFSFGAPK
jgi:hypothetical protein